MISRSTVQVSIPALDEEATIAAVVATLRALGLTLIRVVDNGGVDATAARARAAGAEVIQSASIRAVENAADGGRSKPSPLDDGPKRDSDRPARSNGQRMGATSAVGARPRGLTHAHGFAPTIGPSAPHDLSRFPG